MQARQLSIVTGRVERPNEVPLTYIDADFTLDPKGNLIVSRDDDGDLAWYAPGYWEAVIFGDEGDL